MSATGDAGTVALAAAVNVRVLAPEPLAIVGGLNAAVTPEGKPLTLRVTVPVKLLTGKTVIEVVAVLPCITLVPLPKMVNVGLVSVGTAGNAFCTF